MVAMTINTPTNYIHLNFSLDKASCEVSLMGAFAGMLEYLTY